MELMEAIEARRSVRAYLDRPVEREKLDLLAEALRLAPSACNSQPWKIVFVTEPGLRARVAAATCTPPIPLNKFAASAPALAVLVVERPKASAQAGALVTGRKYPLIDLGIAAEHLCLRATDLGLGSCMLGWFDARRIKRLLGIPAARAVGLVVTLGYPAEGQGQRPEPRPKVRKALDGIRSWERY